MQIYLSRRTDEIIKDIRRLCYAESYSITQGWDDNTAVDILNLAQDKIYGAITQCDNPANIEEFTMDVIATQQAYDLPLAVQMFVRIMDVRFKYGTQLFEFVTLQQSDIQDRFNYPTNIPMVYCIRQGQILLSPTPNITLPGALIINYQKRLNKLDVRRGKVLSVINYGLPFTLQLDYTFLSQKDANLRTNAESVLDFVDWVCLVDRFGNIIVNAIPVATYNVNTLVLTADPAYVIPPLQAAALAAAIASNTLIYVVQGDYASTNSQLDRQCEDGLIEISVARLLSLQSDAAGQAEYMAREEQVLDRLRNQYKRYRPSIFPVRWQGGHGNGSWPFGRRGMN